MKYGRLAGLALCLLISLTYLIDLGQTPVYLGGDEAHFAVIGQRLAETGRNLKGDWLPLFIRLDDPQGPAEDLPWGTTWYQPMLFYAVAVVVKLLPLSIASVRLPTAILGGIINPLLMYFVGVRMFKRRDLAVLSAAILLLSPPLVILGRQALDYAWPVTFVLAWLWLVLAYTDTGRLRLAFLSGLVLGVGCYSYIASWAMMPGYLGLSWLVLFSRRSGRWGAIGLSALGFLIPVALVIPWLWSNPTAFHDIVQRYQVAEDGGSSSVLNGRLNLRGLATLVSIYWDYFDPAYLFLTGGPSMTTSTGRVGVFLVPLAIWLPLGLYALVENRSNWKWNFLLAAGLFAAPLPAVLRGVPNMVQRELLVFPFAALISAHGIALVMRSRRPIAKWAGAITVAAMMLQYGVFVHDYWTHYKRRSAFYYDPAAFSEIAHAIFAVDRSHPIPAVYFGADIDDVGAKWRFFTTAEGHEGLIGRTQYPADPWSVDASPGSLLVVYDERLKVQALVDGGRWKIVEVVEDFDQRTTAVVLTRLE